MSSKRKPQKQPRRAPAVRHMTLGPGPTIECGGKTWRLGFNTQDAKARLEELFRAHVMREAVKKKRALGGKEGQDAYDHDNDAVTDGEYDTFEKGWYRLLAKPAGSVMYLLSLLQEHHPDATAADARSLVVQEPEQTQAAVNAISPDFLCAAAVQNGMSRDDAPRFVAAVVRNLATLAAEQATATAT